MKRTLEEFIKLANKKHLNKYGYNKSIYIDSKTLLTITCPIHGDWEQTPGNHLSGKGCIKCAGISRLTTKDFIHKSNKIHNNKYDYSNTNYLNAKTKVSITCKIHGDFLMLPGNHYKGQGCPECGKTYQANTQKDTTQSFIQKAINIHRDKYDYSKVDYVSSSSNVTIICKKHGEFKQTPNSHLMGSGCHKCTKTGFNPGKPAYLYSFNINGVYKVGVTNRSVKERYNTADFMNIVELQEILFKDGSIAYKIEQNIKETFKMFKYKGPSPFTDGTGITECFTKFIDIRKFSDNYSDIPESWKKFPVLQKISTVFLAPENNPMDVKGTTDIAMS